MRFTTLTAAFLTSTVLAQDPPAPPGGFKVLQVADLPITYSDGYRTALDIRYPAAPPPATGWPVALIVHGGGGSRKRSWVRSLCEIMTRAGYVSLAYDTAGNGITTTLNTPSRRSSEERRITDLAEILYFAEARMGSVMDADRIGVHGKSGGGKHTLWAASFSERTLPIPGLVKKMPKIRAAHSDIQCIDLLEDSLPEGNMIKASWIASEFDRNGATSPLLAQMQAQDFTALRLAFTSSPAMYFYPLLRTSDVPLVVSYSYDDTKHFVNTNSDAFAGLKAGVPRRYLQITGGHGSAPNNVATTLRRDFLRRWFDRFLKNLDTQIDREPFAEVGVIPSSPSEYNDARSEWQHRRSDVWPIAPKQRFYLRAGGRLAGQAPAGIEAGPRLQHRVKSGYDLIRFAQDGTAPAKVLNKIPFESVGWESDPMSEPMELLGRSVVEFDVILTGAAQFQMQAALYDVPPSGPPRFITAGMAARQRVAPGRHRMKIQIGDTAYVLGKGHKLRLALENQAIHRQPNNAHYKVAPCFQSCDLDVQIDPAFAPRLDLPLSPARASLTPRISRVRGSAGVAFDLHVQGEPSRAGTVYQVLIGASGNTPGFNAPPRVPLNVDAVTSIGLSFVNTPLFQDFRGLLNARGEATATLNLPNFLGGALAGTRFNFVVVGIEPGGGYFVSPPAELIIEP